MFSYCIISMYYTVYNVYIILCICICAYAYVCIYIYIYQFRYSFIYNVYIHIDSIPNSFFQWIPTTRPRDDPTCDATTAPGTPHAPTSWSLDIRRAGSRRPPRPNRCDTPGPCQGLQGPPGPPLDPLDPAKGPPWSLLSAWAAAVCSIFSDFWEILHHIRWNPRKK
jgi:hypothetical protein